MKHTNKQWKITGLMTLALFLLFSVCILGVLLTGGNVYRRITDKNAAAYRQRTAVQYLTTRIRQADVAGGIAVTELEGIPALQIQEQIDGRTYLTHIYCQDGYIRELYAQAGRELTPADGEPVIAARQLAFLWEPPMLTLQIQFADTTCRELALTLRSEQEAVS